MNRQLDPLDPEREVVFKPRIHHLDLTLLALELPEVNQCWTHSPTVLETLLTLC